MKTTSLVSLRRLTAAAAIAICTLSQTQATASDLTWDASGANPGSPTGGNGTWSTTNANWSNGTIDSVWDNTNTVPNPADNAIFLGLNLGGSTNGVVALAEPITVGGIAFNANVSGSGNYIITNGANVAANTLTLVGSAAVTLNQSAEIRAIVTGTNGMTVTASANEHLTMTGNNFGGNNTYTGVTTITSTGTSSGGDISVRSLQNGGANSGIGASSNAAANLVLDGGFLRKSAGSANNTDRLFTLTTKGGGLDSDSGTVTATMTFTNTGAVALAGTNTSRTFYLRGSNTGNNTLAPSLGDNGTGATSLTKLESGKWILSGDNTYTGDTTINGGTLSLMSIGELMFKIQDFGSSNQITGSGTLDLDGTLRLDISGLTDSAGTWNLVDVASLSSETFGSNFGLAFTDTTTFIDNGGGIYTSGNWSFDTSTGDLLLVPEPSTAAVVLAGVGVLLCGRRFRRFGA